MTRPKGYAEWIPQPHVAEVIGQVRQIIREYSGYGPMTVRQVFYRLVGEYGYEKTEKAYKRLCEYMVRARRAQLIPFHSIRDDGTSTHGGGGWSSMAGFWRTIHSVADGYERDHQQEQPQAIELWCEAAGMAPMLASMVRDWHIPVYSTGGFGSVTVTHEAAERIAERDRPTLFLHVGDYDPSGESIFTSMAQDIGAFVASELAGEYYPDTGDATDNDGREWFMPERVALTRDQVRRFDLPTAPPKSSDSRSRTWSGSTTQAEAMPPDLLRDVVRSEIAEHIDEDALARVKRRERDDKTEIQRILAETYTD